MTWTPAQLAKASGVSHGTIKRIEAEGGVLGGRLETAQKLVGARRGGVEFTARGVTLKE